MGKKKGNKKGGGDDFWDEAGEVLPSKTNGAASDDEGDDQPVNKTKNAFANMQIEENGNDDDAQPSSSSASKPADDDEDYGGLMSAIKKSGGKKGKKGKKQQEEIDWDAIQQENEEANGVHDTDKAPVAGNIEDEFPEDDKPKKGKNDVPSQTASPAPEPADAEEDDAGPKILTKAEKEKLKKEKEKAKKKAQAAAKKAATGGGAATQESTAPTPAPEADSKPAADDDDEDDGEDGDDGTAADKKKKKKKKKAAATPAPAPAASGKKPNAALAALQARMAAQKKAEEELRLAQEEAERAEAERERLEKEEADRKEAERLRKKEKEKAKKDQLRKEGKLLTPKQKQERAAAEARLEAMRKSGTLHVPSLANREDADDSKDQKKSSKVVDSRKKNKKQPGGPRNQLLDTSATPASTEEAPEEVASPAPEETARAASPVETAEAPAADAPDDWAADSADGDVKEDWDAESEDESAKPTAKPAQAAEPKAAANGAKSAATAKTEEAESDEEDDDSDDDDDSDEDDSDEESSEDELTAVQKQAAEKKALAAQRREEQHQQALAARNKDDLRSPICCILGHVDTGKTKLLDKIRQTNVQEGEAGGITQQIGATYFPVETLQKKIAPIDPDGKQAFKTPGLLVIDTPGHESFTNLRTRGSSLCNIAILVVDIMHGLEPQTLESIRLLRDKKTPFIVALNKVDRLYGWKATPDGGFRQSLAKQDRATRNEFEERAAKTMVAFAEQGLNACLYYDNKNFAKNVSLVPTSAHTGEGIPDMLQLLVNLTQERMSESLMYLSELECTVLEVKVIEGLGTTIDVVLSNGTMREGDKIVVCGLNGPIVTQVRALLTPQPMKEMRIKGAYVHHKMVKAALGVKISAPDLDKAIAGSRLLVCGPDDDEEDLKDEVMSDLSTLMDSIDKSGRGVCVQASTLGSLEALLEFLRTSKIPVSGINIGPVFKKDVMRASTIIEKAKELACILCFDVTVDKEAERLAEELGVRLFKADIIYHLFDAFTAYNKEVMEQKQKEAAPNAVWPCRLKILACFARRDPIIIGAELLDNVDLRVGTPLCAIKNKEIIPIGRVTSLEVNHTAKQVVTKREAGAGVAVKIECASHETPKLYGRHFDDSDVLYSTISRSSIDALKDHFWSTVTLEQKKLIKNMKPLFNVP